MPYNPSILISPDPLSIDKAFAHVNDSSCGGNCLFIGTTRRQNQGHEITHLDFESYISMASKEMKAIADRAMSKYDINKIAVHHRTGRVNLKEIAVIIATASPHRDAAFQACRFAIDELKKTVPIWKKEFAVDGSYWVMPHP